MRNKQKNGRRLAIFLVLLLVAFIGIELYSPQKASAAIAFDKSLGTKTENAANNPLTLTTNAAAVSASRVILIVAWQGDRTLSTVTGGSLTWTVDEQGITNVNNFHVGIASASASSGLASSTTISANFSAGTSLTTGLIAAMSATGLATTSAVDNSHKSPQAGVTGWTDSVSTTAANTFVVGGSSIDSCPNITNTATSPNAEVHDFNDGNFCGSLATEYRIESTSGSKTVNGTWSTASGSQSNETVVVAYKAPSNNAPAAPTLSSPASGATAVTVLPSFQLRTTDTDNDYLRYRIKVYNNSGGTGSANCTADSATNLVRDIDQTSSQTGWSGQDQQASTAYTGNSSISSSTMATHTYQSTALSVNTLYYWKGQAIDPGGSNTFGSWSACQSFTTVTAITNVEIDGGTTIQGGTIIQ